MKINLSPIFVLIYQGVTKPMVHRSSIRNLQRFRTLSKSLLRKCKRFKRICSVCKKMSSEIQKTEDILMDSTVSKMSILEN